MGKKILLSFGLVLVGALAGAGAFYGAEWLSMQTDDDADEAGEVIGGVAPVPPVPPVPVSPQPGSQTASREDIKANNPDGPWGHDLMFATSADGTAFSVSAVFVERAGVPSLVRDANDRLVAVFQWFPDDDDAWDKVAVAFSEDEGKTWTDPKSIAMSGLPDGFQRPYDPTITLAEDGTLRLYFTSSADRPGPQQMTQIYAATSEDGVNYVFEGLALAIDGHRLFDCAALRLGSVWHLMTPLTPDLGAYHAVSNDGKTFERTDDISVPGWNWGGNLIAWGDSAMRFYGTESMRRGIWWSETTDGTTWSEPTATGLSGNDPGIVELADGTYLIVYVN